MGSKMELKNLIYEVKENVGILTVNRPKFLNALNRETLSEMRTLLKKIKEENSVRVLIITGSGEKAFIAGADITEFETMGLADSFEFSRYGQALTLELETLGIPTIAAVNGLALGGGFEVALACNLRVASETAKFGLPELSLGGIPGFGGTQRLPRLIGKGRALYYLLTGELVDASKALEWGLVSQIVPGNQLLDCYTKLAQKILTKSPLAVKLAISAIHFGMEVHQETGMMLETALMNVSTASQDYKEGLSAFKEKRTPVFKGK